MKMTEIPQQVKEHCEKHKNCVGCAFVGSKCVAPVSDQKFNDWIQEMIKLITIEGDQ